jgi:hypothetical protein
VTLGFVSLLVIASIMFFAENTTFILPAFGFVTNATSGAGSSGDQDNPPPPPDNNPPPPPPPDNNPPPPPPPDNNPPPPPPPYNNPPPPPPPDNNPPPPPPPDTNTRLPEDGNIRSDDGTATTIPESATATDLLSSDPTPHNNIWEEHKNKYHGFIMMYPFNWTFTNSTIASSTEPYVAAQFCPTDSGLLDVSSQCQASIEGQANDRIWVTVYPSLTNHYQFSGDNATMLVEQFMHQDMNRTAAAWQSYEVINRTTTTINATDEGSITQTRIVSVPAIIVDYRHSEDANDFRNVELYTIFAGKGYVLQYLPRISIELTGDNVQENAQGFYPSIIEDIFMTFSPMRSLQ